MKIIERILAGSIFYIASIEAFAHNQRSLTTSVIINVVPILIFVVVWIILMRGMGKKTAAVNDKIVESNEEVARQVKRIADHLEKSS